VDGRSSQGLCTRNEKTRKTSKQIITISRTVFDSQNSNHVRRVSHTRTREKQKNKKQNNNNKITQKLRFPENEIWIAHVPASQARRDKIK
jgi:hypothetical protein